MELSGSKLTGKTSHERAEGKFTFTLLMRRYEEDQQSYYVAECLEIPGCVADGETEDEAVQHLNEAIKACVGVIFEDCIRQAGVRGLPTRDFVGITSQRTVELSFPELQYA